MKKVLYICNLKKDFDLITSEQIINLLKQNDALIYVEEKELSAKYNLNLISEDILTKIDLTVVLGGDGTLLKYFRTYGQYEIPVMGINMGRVGALTTVNFTDYSKCLADYFDNKYEIVEQFSLVGTIKYHNGQAKSFNIYNEAVLYRGTSLKLLPINVSVNGSQSDEIYADGIIIATPTGSSAYNLSAGGPLLSPNCGCYAITPICPQIKSFSSLVVSKNDNATFYLPNASEEVIISVDGCEKYPIGVNDKLFISLSKTNIHLLKFSNNESLYQAIYKIIASIKNKGER